MPQCVTCGTELHPERAQKYAYCMAPECREENAKGLTIVAVGVNKSADQFMILDERTREELASGKYHDQRRGSFGTSAPPLRSDTSADRSDASEGRSGASADRSGAGAGTAASPEPARSRARPGPLRRPSPRKPVRRPWSRSQEKLAVIYNQQGLRPDEIARKLGLSTYTVTQIILASRNRGKL